ncbi:MAG TPA: ATP-dependent zinc metalloprotease FtsH [Cytophagaceae bacterium]|nr:ATP-dependent zinc metalloprotease FtsH [Cytophagaceae bacterium]
MSTSDPGSQKQEKGKTRGLGKPWRLLNLLLPLILLALFLYQFMNSADFKEISWNDFEKLLESRKVGKVVIVNKETAEVYLRQDTSHRKSRDLNFNQESPQYYFNIGSPEVFEEKLYRIQESFPEKDKIKTEYKTEKNWFTNVLLWLFPFVIFFLAMRWLSRGAEGFRGNSIFSFGQSGARLFENDKITNITFNDLAGLDEAKQEMKETVDFLKNPQDYTRLGARIPKGILLIGPPGTGKTLMARAVAGEARVSFFSLSGSEFVEMFVGVGASRVRDLFKRAKEKAPCIIFIDEIDAIGRSRGKIQSFNSNDERENTLNQLLAEMDGFSNNSGVIVLAATNRGDILDRALLRPGRFDRRIYLELPDLRERKEIFNVHIRPLLIDETVDVEALAAQTPGFSGADVANICNEAALIAARRKKTKIGKEEFSEALDRVIGGLEKRKKIISPKERNIVAFHEAGHALATCYLKGLKEIVKVSIIPRGRSLGAAWYRPEELQLITFTQLQNEICIMLAGRAAEEVILGEITSGALDDLERVTKQAYSMIAFYGLSGKIGNISFYDSTGSQESPFQKPYSEETAKIIDEEVRNLVNTAYQKVKTLLEEHKQELQKTGELLLEKEVIYKEDLEKIVQLNPRNN